MEADVSGLNGYDFFKYMATDFVDVVPDRRVILNLMGKQ